MDKSLKSANHNQPTDKGNLAYFILMLQGIGFLLPWNVFINAREYFQDYKLNTTISANADYRENFLIYVGFASQFPGLAFAAFHTFFQAKTSNQFMSAMLIEMFILFFTIILIFIDTSNIPGIFFGLTIISVAVINCCVGIHQTLTFGIAATLPMKYSTGVVIGSNACGTIISLFSIITKAASQVFGHTNRSRIIAAVAYFSSAFIIVISCLVTYFVLARLEFVRYFKNLGEIEVTRFNDSTDPEDIVQKLDEKVTSQGSFNQTVKRPSHCVNSNTPLLGRTQNPDIPQYNQQEDQDIVRSSTSSAVPEVIFVESSNNDSIITTFRRCFGLCCFKSPYGRIHCRNYWMRYWLTFKECWPFCLSVWLVFLCSLSIFPSILTRVKPIDENYSIPAMWFSDVTCYLFFNFFAMMGCILANFVQIPGPKWLWMPVVVRIFVFIPFFMCSNIEQKNFFGTYVTNDNIYVFGTTLFGFSNGYLSSLCMMYAPSNSPPERAQLAGTLTAFFLVFGVFSGVNVSRFLVML